MFLAGHKEHKESRRGVERRYVEAIRPWSVRKVELLREINLKGTELSPTFRSTRRIEWGFGTHHQDIHRLVREGYVVRTGKSKWLRIGRRERNNYVVLTDKGKAALAEASTERVPEPYAKRRAGMAEFRQANRV